MNEKKKGANKSYWTQKNMDHCYMDALQDLERKSRKGKIPNYFNQNENILEGKDKKVLLELANFAKTRLDELTYLSQ